MPSFSSNLRGGRRRKFKSEINVVPYIDVMLVLLIIFMVVPPANSPSVINLPTAAKSALPPTDYIQIALQPDGPATIGVNGEHRETPQTQPDRAALVNALRSLHDSHPDYPVLIAGDKNIKYDDVIQLISEAKKIGINRVGLATK